MDNSANVGKTEQKTDSGKLIRRGSFRISYNNEGKLVLFCIIGALLCIAMFIVGLVLFGAPEDFLGFMGSVFWIIPAVVCVVLIPVIIWGRTCSYSTDEIELQANMPGGPEYLYYSDISEVIYKPFLLFGKPRGLLVTVVTSVRDFTYRYIYSSDELTEPEHTPFYLLEINSGLKQPQNSDPELTAAIMSQFAVMQEKQTDRLSKKRPKKTWKNLFDD